MATTVLKIKGMSCGHCVDAVKTALQNVPGVKNAEVDLENGRAAVDFDASKTTVDKLALAVEEEGYSVVQ